MKISERFLNVMVSHINLRNANPPNPFFPCCLRKAVVKAVHFFCITQIQIDWYSLPRSCQARNAHKNGNKKVLYQFSSDLEFLKEELWTSLFKEVSSLLRSQHFPVAFAPYKLCCMFFIPSPVTPSEVVVLTACQYSQASGIVCLQRVLSGDAPLCSVCPGIVE